MLKIIPMKAKNMKIGDLGKATGTQVEAIRYYEREGLLPSPARTEANYRVYQQTHIERLGFIRHCRCLDMTLDEIRLLLRFKDAPQSDCGAVDRVLDDHIDHVVVRIRELNALEKQLRQLRDQCTTDADGCGVIGGWSALRANMIMQAPEQVTATSTSIRPAFMEGARFVRKCLLASVEKAISHFYHEVHCAETSSSPRSRSPARTLYFHWLGTAFAIGARIQLAREQDFFGAAIGGEGNQRRSRRPNTTRSAPWSFQRRMKEFAGA